MRIRDLVILILIVFFVLISYLNWKFKSVELFLDDAFSVFDKWRLVSFVISVIFIALIVYTITRLNLFLSEVRKEEVAAGILEKPSEPEKISRWEKVLAHLNSASPGDWKLAILEADNILDEIFSSMGYPGKGLGDRLKMVQKSDFKSLDDIWEAHKFRNQIVHEAPTYEIKQEEARRIVRLYERGLREFGYL